MTRQILFVFGNQACVPDDGLLAARQMGCTTTVMGAQLACCMSAELVDRFERVDLRRPDKVVEAARRIHAFEPIHAVVAYDDQGTPLAARIAAALGLPGHPIEAADAARDKVLMKQRFAAAGVPIAPYVLAQDEDDAVRWAGDNGYPVVVKPVRGSASQGVIRADDEAGLRQAYRRLRRIVLENRLDCGDRSDAQQLVEGYLDGAEYSVELFVRGGVPSVLCVFEKPLPLTGPFFEETIYATPARLAPEEHRQIEDLARRGAVALGLRDGFGHCELRSGSRGMAVLEIGARLIGGACSRVFRYVLDEDIHPYVLRLALGDEVAPPRQAAGAAGAMMLPITCEGTLKAVRGLERARQVPGVKDVILNTSPGEVILSFPEASCYVGFVTAQAASVEDVANALAEASRRIDFEVAPLDCETWFCDIANQRSFRPPAELGIGTLEGHGLEEAEERVVPLVAATYFAEFPPALGREKAEHCLRWFEDGHRGQTDPSTWFTSEGRGVALGSVRDDTCYVSLLGVVPGQRKTGLGEALVRSVMAHFAGKGCSRMEIAVEPRQRGNMAFFRRLGFSPATCDGHECCTC